MRKSEIPSSEFFPISGDWSELGISNLVRMSLIKCYKMPGYSFYRFWVIKRKPTVKLPPLSPPRLGLIYDNEMYRT